MRSRLRLLCIAAVSVLVTGIWAAPAHATHNQDQHSPQANALANIPRSSDFRWNDPALGRNFQSDLAFRGKLAIAGNYNGFRVIDISDPAHPRVVRDVWCPGPQNDVSIWGDVIVASVDDVLTSPACGSVRAVPQTDPSWGDQFVPQLLIEGDRGGGVPGVQAHAGVEAGGACAQRGGVGVAAGDLVGEDQFEEVGVGRFCCRARMSRSGSVFSSLPSFRVRSTCLRSALTGSGNALVAGFVAGGVLRAVIAWSPHPRRRRLRWCW
jgi:hypothetical protein